MAETSSTAKYSNLCDKGIYCQDCKEKANCEVVLDIVRSIKRNDLEEVKKEEEV